jgi:hypothetical protein
MVRVSLTKKERQTQAGLDLIALCQTVTEDGSISPDEAHQLMCWLADNEDCGLPAHAFLCDTVRLIIADGKITADERKQLYEAIEKVLPPELRGLVRERRRAVAQAEAELLAPLETLDFFCAGVRYAGRMQIVENYVRVDDKVMLVREPKNRHSRNAIQIVHPAGVIGYVPENVAAHLALLIDDGHPTGAAVWKLHEAGSDGKTIPIIYVEVLKKEAVEHLRERGQLKEV